jgi:hypothetical protein
VAAVTTIWLIADEDAEAEKSRGSWSRCEAVGMCLVLAALILLRYKVV